MGGEEEEGGRLAKRVFAEEGRGGGKALASPRADWYGDGGEAQVARGEVDLASTGLNLVSRYGFG